LKNNPAGENLLIEIIIFLISFNITLALMPFFINKMKEKGFISSDMHKLNKPLIPQFGGIAILFGIVASIIMINILLPESEIDLKLNFFAFNLILLLFGIFGFVDDIFGVDGKHLKPGGERWRILVPFSVMFLLAIPISSITQTSNVHIPFIGYVEFGLIYFLILGPIYVMACANLFNMFEGLNGLCSGTTVIILSFIILKSYLYSQMENVILILPLFGASIVFFLFNKYPSQVFPGNVGTFTMGAGIGAILMVQRFYLAGIIMCGVHIIHYLMFMSWVMKKEKIIKFGGIRKDGTIKSPSRRSLVYFIPAYYRVTEKQLIMIFYLLTIIFCLVGLFIPW